MKTFKLIIFSIVFIVLFLPTACSTYIASDKFFGNWSIDNPQIAKSGFNNEIDYYLDWCKKNNFGGQTIGDDEKRLRDCLDNELRMGFMVPLIMEGVVIIFYILVPIFIIYLTFYVWWIRRNYFNKKNA